MVSWAAGEPKLNAPSVKRKQNIVEMIEAARKAQQQNEQKHDVQLSFYEPEEDVQQREPRDLD